MTPKQPDNAKDARDAQGGQPGKPGPWQTPKMEVVPVASSEIGVGAGAEGGTGHS